MYPVSCTRCVYFCVSQENLNRYIIRRNSDEKYVQRTCSSFFIVSTFPSFVLSPPSTFRLVSIIKVSFQSTNDTIAWRRLITLQVF